MLIEAQTVCKRYKRVSRGLKNRDAMGCSSRWQHPDHCSALSRFSDRTSRGSNNMRPKLAPDLTASQMRFPMNRDETVRETGVASSREYARSQFEHVTGQTQRGDGLLTMEEPSVAAKFIPFMGKPSNILSVTR